MKILHNDADDHHGHGGGASGEIDNNKEERLLGNEISDSKKKASDATATTTNINVESAYLHVLGDMLMSCGVILAATIIYFRPDMWWCDPICTYVFALMICFTSYPTLKNCIDVMMEKSPDSINTAKLTDAIYAVGKGDITDIHDLHVWELSVGKISMTVHIKSKKPLKTLAAVTDMCRRDYGLFHTTI